jgi:DNA-binding transcriptional regulator YhcF (GntR family)
MSEILLKNKVHASALSEAESGGSSAALRDPSPSTALSEAGISIIRTVQSEIEQKRANPDFFLSHENQLAERFSVHPSTIKRVMRSLETTELLFWRSNVVRPDGRSEHKIEDKVVDYVREELRKFQLGEMQDLSSEKEISKECGVTEGLVYRRLRDSHTGLSPEEWAVRRRVMNAKKGENGVDSEFVVLAEQLVKTVKEEIAQHRAGALQDLSSNHELRSRFKVGEHFIQRHLTSKERGQLSAADRRYRRSVLAKDTNRKTFERHGCPLTNTERSPEQRRADFFKGHSKRLKTYEAQGGHPLTKLTTEQRQKNGEKAWETKKVRYSPAELRKGREKALDKLRRRRGIQHNDQLFDSFQEAACGMLFEKYLPEFRLEKGVSFQRPINGAQFDFVYKSAVIEWHPVLLFVTRGGVGSFPNQEMYEKFQSRKREIEDRDDRRRYVERVRGVFEYRYRQVRRGILDESKDGASLALIVLHTPQQLFDKVIEPIGSGFPSRESFIREFNRLTLELSRKHKAKS